MLQENEIKKILGLIKQRKTNYRIWKETGYSVNTIDTIRKNSENTETTQIQEEDVPYTNPIDKTRGIIADIDSLIQTGQLDDKDRKIWKKRAEQIREILKVEADDRISSERADAVEKRDQEWKKDVEQNYVKKDVVTGLEGKIQERDTSITRLRDKNTEKDKVHEKDLTTIMNLSNTQQNMYYQIQNLTNTITVLNNNYWQLQYYIENWFDIEVRQSQDQLRVEREVFNAENKHIVDDMNNLQLNLINLNTDVEMRRKAVEMRENKVAGREEKLEKQENELEASKNRWNKQYSEFITSIKTRVDNIAYDYCDELVKRCFEKQITKIDQQRKEIKD
jgi:hypothetical protein